MSPNETIVEVSLIPSVTAGGIAIGPDGNAWTCVTNSTQLNYLARISPSLHVDYFPLELPNNAGITVASDNSIWFTYNNNNYIGRYCNGNITNYNIQSLPLNPIIIKAGNDGAVYFTLL